MHRRLPVALVIITLLALAGCTAKNTSTPTGATGATPAAGGGNGTADAQKWSGSVSAGAGAPGVGNVAGPGSDAYHEFTPKSNATRAKLVLTWTPVAPSAANFRVQIVDPNKKDPNDPTGNNFVVIQEKAGPSPLAMDLTSKDLGKAKYGVQVYIDGGAGAQQPFDAVFTFNP